MGGWNGKLTRAKKEPQHHPVYRKVSGLIPGQVAYKKQPISLSTYPQVRIKPTHTKDSPDTSVSTPNLVLPKEAFPLPACVTDC